MESKPEKDKYKGNALQSVNSSKMKYFDGYDLFSIILYFCLLHRIFSFYLWFKYLTSKIISVKIIHLNVFRQLLSEFFMTFCCL